VEDIIDFSEETLPCAHPGIRMSRPTIPNPAVLRSAICELEALAIADRSDELRTRLKGLTGDPQVLTFGGVR
jgi:hypothetical protein